MTPIPESTKAMARAILGEDHAAIRSARKVLSEPNRTMGRPTMHDLARYKINDFEAGIVAGLLAAQKAIGSDGWDITDSERRGLLEKMTRLRKEARTMTPEQAQQRLADEADMDAVTTSTRPKSAMGNPITEQFQSVAEDEALLAEADGFVAEEDEANSLVRRLASRLRSQLEGE